MNSHIPPKIFDQHLITHRKRHVIKPILILIAVVAVTLVLFKLATFPRPATAAGNKDFNTYKAEILASLPKPLKTMKNGDHGYIALSDIETHPLLNIMIAEETYVSPKPTTDQVIHITVANDIIVIDPISVQKAIRYVAMGPVPDAQKHLMTSTTFLTGIPPDDASSLPLKSLPPSQPGIDH